MTAPQGMTLKLEERRFKAALSEFLRRRAPAVAERAARKIALDIGAEVVKSLNGEEAGYPNPKRVDTGRYRAGWCAAVGLATGIAPGPTAAAQAGDGSGRTDGAGLRRTVTVENNVEYGPYVEFGTHDRDGGERMEPGLHLHRALRVGTRAVQRLVGDDLADEWVRGG